MKLFAWYCYWYLLFYYNSADLIGYLCSKQVPSQIALVHRKGRSSLSLVMSRVPPSPSFSSPRLPGLDLRDRQSSRLPRLRDRIFSWQNRYSTQTRFRVSFFPFKRIWFFVDLGTDPNRVLCKSWISEKSDSETESGTFLSIEIESETSL